MISKTSDSRGRILGYMEWRLVGQSGFDKMDGEYIYIADFWIHTSHKNDWSMFRELMWGIFAKSPSARYIYFNRRKYGGRQSKVYTREQIMKLMNRVPMMVMKVVS